MSSAIDLFIEWHFIAVQVFVVLKINYWLQINWKHWFDTSSWRQCQGHNSVWFTEFDFSIENISYSLLLALLFYYFSVFCIGRTTLFSFSLFVQECMNYLYCYECGMYYKQFKILIWHIIQLKESNLGFNIFYYRKDHQPEKNIVYNIRVMLCDMYK